MATEVKLPRLGQGMESGTIVRWLKAEGDAVQKREPLYELDTDKVTQEVESDIDGVLLKIVVAEGEVGVGSTIAVIGNDGEEVSLEAEASPSPDTDSMSSPSGPGGTGSVVEQQTSAAPVESGSEPQALPSGGNGDAASIVVVSADGRIKASPLARRIARERGIDLASLPGTGPDGRIVAEDVENAPAGGAPALGSLPAPAAEIEVVTMTSIRKTIARRLTEAWTAPVFQLGVSIDMTEALHLREQLVARLLEGDVKPTVNDLLTRLVGVALVRHRAVNATFTGEEIHRHPGAQIGMAVAAPNGLMVPFIRDADRRSVQEIARARADLVGRAREGKLTL
jgi:pyruvate dehydrogenase E2 component (dihydrolipoamide acetyltransferase)